MARSFSITDNRQAVINFPAISIYFNVAGVSRARLFEFEIGSGATPADAATIWGLTRISVAAPTGGTALIANIMLLDPAEPASGMLSMGAATGGCTVAAAGANFAVNQRATFRWVAAPTKEVVVPITQFAGVGLTHIVAQTAAYTAALTLMWEE